MDRQLRADACSAVRRRVKVAWLLPFLPLIVDIVYRIVVAWLDRKSEPERAAVFAANREAMRAEPL